MQRRRWRPSQLMQLRGPAPVVGQPMPLLPRPLLSMLTRPLMKFRPSQPMQLLGLWRGLPYQMKLLTLALVLPLLNHQEMVLHSDPNWDPKIRHQNFRAPNLSESFQLARPLLQLLARPLLQLCPRSSMRLGQLMPRLRLPSSTGARHSSRSSMRLGHLMQLLRLPSSTGARLGSRSSMRLGHLMQLLRLPSCTGARLGSRSSMRLGQLMQLLRLQSCTGARVG
jgi:hypothetical protein